MVTPSLELLSHARARGRTHRAPAHGVSPQIFSPTQALHPSLHQGALSKGLGRLCAGRSVVSDSF